MIYKQPPSWLAHHGVEGQRWGVKHGPPYPLDDDISTGSRLKISTNNDFTDKDNLRVKHVTHVYGKRKGRKEKSKILKEKQRINENQQYLYDNYEKEVIDYLDKADAFDKKYRSLFDEYYDNRDKYAEIAANIAYDKWSPKYSDVSSKDYDRAFWIYGYVMDDLDQGNDSSQSLFFLDKKRKNYDKFMDQYLEDKEIMDDSRRKLYDALKEEHGTKHKSTSTVIEAHDTLDKILKDNGLPEDLDYVMYEAYKMDDSNWRKELLAGIDKYKDSSFDWERILNEQE